MSGWPVGRRISIAYVITDLMVGGVPLHLARLATRLPPGRFAPRVISLAEAGPVADRLVEAGVPVHACGARGPLDLPALWRLGRCLAACRPDLVHALLFHANIAVRSVAPWIGLPPSRIICEIQTAEVERRWHLWLDNLTCRLCRLEVGNSPSVVAHLHRHGHLPLRRLCCMWGAVEVDRFARARPLPREVLGVPANVPLVIWTGRLDPVKGFEEMLAAFERVRRKHPAHLLLAGEGPYRPTVESLVRAHGLHDAVTMLGQRNDIPSLLRTADVFLFCSRTEGLPNAVLEAMAAGLPVVATDVPGCRDLVQHGRTGLLARPGDPASIAAQLGQVLERPQEARRWGETARSWVSLHANAAALGETWAKFYERILDESR